MNEDEIEKAKKSAMDAVKKSADSFNIWICNKCKDNPEFTVKEFKEHLKFHGIADPEKIKGTRTMLMHIDGKRWYQTSYTWVIEGISFSQVVREKRARNDPMGFDD